MKQQPEKKSSGELKLLNLNLEEKGNLVGLFALMMKVDKRNNPENYKS